MPTTVMEWLEFASYVATAAGVPLALGVFWLEQRRERENEEAEVYELLSRSYTDFLKLVIANPDLGLRSKAASKGLTAEQLDRQKALFEILIALFERAHLYAYSEDPPTNQRRRRWNSWEDYIREWCRREDFRRLLPDLLNGEDETFATYMRMFAAKVAGAGGAVDR